MAQTITSEQVNWYRNSLNEQMDGAARYVSSELDLDCTKAKQRFRILKNLKDAMSVYGDNAQQLAVELYNYIMQTQGSDAAARFYDDIIDQDLVDKKVRWYVNQYDDPGVLLDKIKDYSKFLVNFTAHDAMLYNCFENHTLYALIPTGYETCGFCYMLASRGFVYSTKKDKWKNGLHMHCDCVTLPSSKKDTIVEGYDPDYLYEKYDEARKNAGSGKPADVVKAIEQMGKEKGWNYMYGK